MILVKFLIISHPDDDWITEGEKHDGSSNFDLLGVIDSATRRKNGKEDENDDEENLKMLGWSVMELKMI